MCYYSVLIDCSPQELFFIATPAFSRAPVSMRVCIILCGRAEGCQVEALNSCQYLKRRQLNNLVNVYNERLNLYCLTNIKLTTTSYEPQS